mmetsp:Transcript_16842/g.21851  ORF Transcript_16842/g.21851 Transcript_16842/m.21851 type:complete len:368 (+) Transcript_16842:807-1910(+)
MGHAGSKDKHISHDDVQDRFRGAMLGTLVGDAFGAPFEGRTSKSIRDGSTDLAGRLGYYCGAHMGDPNGEIRQGMYTDDSNQMLALAQAIIKEHEINPKTIAQCSLNMYQINKQRFYPSSTIKVFEAIKNNVSIEDLGTINYAEGSYANGGAVKMAPLALFSANLDDSELDDMIKQALLPTHVHPDAIAGAKIMVAAIRYLINCENESFAPIAFLEHLIHLSKDNQEIYRRLITIKNFIENHPNRWASVPYGLRKQPEGATREIYGEMGFQIEAFVAVPAAIWAFLSHQMMNDQIKNPGYSLRQAVVIGGDTDTIAAMTGALLGALHGTKWIDENGWFEGLENEEFGRDYCLRLADKLFLMSYFPSA